MFPDQTKCMIFFIITKLLCFQSKRGLVMMDKNLTCEKKPAYVYVQFLL